MKQQGTGKKNAVGANGRAKVASEAPRVSAVLARIEALWPSLGRVGQRIAAFIAKHPQDVVHMSVSEVAERTGSSEGSIVALCKTLGATGFQQIKIALAQDLVQPVQFIHEDLEPTDSADVAIRKIFQSNVQTLHDTQAALDVGAVKKAVALLRKARRIEIYGVGSAAAIAEDAHYRMLRIGLDVKVAVDSHVQAISAALTGPGVATLTISHSGSTHETVTATRLAKEAGASTICITNLGKSPIQAFSDVTLFTMAKETNFRTEAMTSRLAQLAIIDVLIACLALGDYERSVKTLRGALPTSTQSMPRRAAPMASVSGLSPTRTVEAGSAPNRRRPSCSSSGPGLPRTCQGWTPLAATSAPSARRSPAPRHHRHRAAAVALQCGEEHLAD